MSKYVTMRADYISVNDLTLIKIRSNCMLHPILITHPHL